MSDARDRRGEQHAHAPMQRVGVLPSTSRIAQVIEHNRGIRRRLIADIEGNAELAGLNGARLAALLLQMTSERSCSDLTLEQLRRVAAELRHRVSRHRQGRVSHRRPGDSSAGTAAAGELGAPAAAPSPSSTPTGDAS